MRRVSSQSTKLNGDFGGKNVGTPAWVIASFIGSVGLILAALGGVGFVNSGEATSSLVMALGFLLALIAYGMVLYLTRVGRVVR